MGIPFLPFGFGDCQTLLLQGSCFGLFLILCDPTVQVLFLFVVCFFVSELRFLYWFWSSSVARPLVFPEGVRVVLGRLPCPWSVAAVAVASSAC